MSIGPWETLSPHQRAVMEACLKTETDFVWRGPSELLVAQDGARLVIEALRQSGHSVIGMDGFELASDGVLQRLDLIYDPGLTGRLQDAASIVAQWPSEVWVEFVLGDSS
ncbi:MAG: hypothetical protein L0H31_10555 [Nocardioidaceae bacterium]|nr:hypothetical protein [Nocardioidaceae bacterium]